MADRDQIHLVMHSPLLNTPISLLFIPLKELTPRRFMFGVERVLQSHEEFTLSNDLSINLIHVKMPSGSGNGKRRSGRVKPFFGVNLQTRMLRKRCMIPIHNNDELCGARAIVTAIARIEGSNYPAYREAKPIQRTKALELQHKAGVPLTPCGIEEIKLFQAVLPEYQLVVVSWDYFNVIIYKGPETQKPIYLYHHDGQYEVTTSMPAFLGRLYFCLKCEKGYNIEDWRHHACANKCRCCHHIACPNQGDTINWDNQTN